MDLCSVTQAGGKRLFSFLTQAFGLMADLGQFSTFPLSALLHPLLAIPLSPGSHCD